MKVGVYILAAGASRRLGQPKQLLRFRNSTLLNHVIDTCQRAGFEIVNVILGAHHEKIAPSIPEEANILINNNWNFGMATSIHLAVENHHSSALSITCVATQGSNSINSPGA